MDPNRESAKVAIDSIHKQLQDFIRAHDVPGIDSRMSKVLLEAEICGNTLASLRQIVTFGSLQPSISVDPCLKLCRISLDELKLLSTVDDKRQLTEDDFRAMKNTLKEIWRPISSLQRTFLTSSAIWFQDDLAQLSAKVDRVIACGSPLDPQRKEGNRVTFNGEVTFRNCRVDFNGDANGDAGAAHFRTPWHRGRDLRTQLVARTDDGEDGDSGGSHESLPFSQNSEDNASTRPSTTVRRRGSLGGVKPAVKGEGSVRQEPFSFYGRIWPKGGSSDQAKSVKFRFDARRTKNWISDGTLQSLGPNVFVEPYARHGKSSEAFDGSPTHPTGAVQLSWTKNGTNVKSGEFLIQQESRFGVILGGEFMEEDSVLGLDKVVPIHHSTVRFTPKREASHVTLERAKQRKKKNQELTWSRDLKVKTKRFLQKVTPSPMSHSDASSAQTPRTQDSKTDSGTRDGAIISRRTL